MTTNTTQGELLRKLTDLLTSSPIDTATKAAALVQCAAMFALAQECNEVQFVEVCRLSFRAVRKGLMTPGRGMPWA